MRIPFVDLQAQYRSIKQDIDAAIGEVVQSCAFVGGKAVAEFEREFATYCEAKFALGVANGSDALELALRALDIGPGDEVIVPSHTFIATAAAVARAGATPVFADVDAAYYTIDPDEIEKAITTRTRAIIPVHIYGQPAGMRPIMELARRRNLFVIEDAAQAHGAYYEGQRIGSIGHVACFSFYPGKNLGAYGDGGAITTNDAALVDRLGRLRDHGRLTKYEHAMVGANSRLDTIQAAVLRIKLRHLDRWNELRAAAAGSYAERLARSSYRTPGTRQGSTHVFHLYVVETEQRDDVLARLDAAGVSVGIHYPLPLHLQPAFAHLGYAKGAFPRTERLAGRILSLPIYPELTEAQIDRVCAELKSIERTTLAAELAPA